SPVVALLTDFGTADGYPGVMKGVILGIAPQVHLVDVTHDVPPQDVRAGAWLLSIAWRYFPAGTIFLCVVDPGVGTARRPVAVRAGDRFLVGPDNGLFSLVLATATAERAVCLDNLTYQLAQRSTTFQGRDIFAPCAAHLAAGMPLEVLGTPLDPETLITLALPQPTWSGETLVGRVLYVDHFGNLITDLGPTLTSAFRASSAATVRIAGRIINARAATFAEGPEGVPFLVRDSSGHLAIAVRNGSAAALLGVGRDAEVTLCGLRSSGT